MIVTSEKLLFSSHTKPGVSSEYSLKQKYPQKHNHYSFENYFQFQSDTGIVTDWNEARTLGDVGKPVCHLYAGLFAGFFSDLVRKTLSCIEIQCYSMGETYCKFLLGTKDRIDAVAFWQNEGATARDIEKRLRNGERLR